MIRNCFAHAVCALLVVFFSVNVDAQVYNAPQPGKQWAGKLDTTVTVGKTQQHVYLEYFDYVPPGWTQQGGKKWPCILGLSNYNCCAVIPFATPVVQGLYALWTDDLGNMLQNTPVTSVNPILIQPPQILLDSFVVITPQLYISGSLDSLKVLFQSIPKTFNVDPNRIYIMGNYTGAATGFDLLAEKNLNNFPAAMVLINLDFEDVQNDYLGWLASQSAIPIATNIPTRVYTTDNLNPQPHPEDGPDIVWTEAQDAVSLVNNQSGGENNFVLIQVQPSNMLGAWENFYGDAETYTWLLSHVNTTQAAARSPFRTGGPDRAITKSGMSDALGRNQSATTGGNSKRRSAGLFFIYQSGIAKKMVER